MGIANSPLLRSATLSLKSINDSDSMSQDYNQTGLFNFSNDFEVEQQQHIAQQLRRDKLRIQVQQSFDPPPSLVAVEDDNIQGNYEQAGMLSEMFNFHIPQQQQHHTAAAAPREWYGNRHPTGDQSAAAAMQLFLMNPPPQRSPNSPPSTLNMLLPHHTSATPSLQPFHQVATANPQFSWVPDVSNPSHQGLSLSLSSSLQQMDVAKQEEYRAGDSEFFFQGYHGNYRTFPGAIPGNHMGFGPSSSTNSSSLGVVNVLRNSKYAKGAQELLEEFCSVGRAYLKKNKFTRQNSKASEGATSATPPKDLPPLSAADRIEHQRRKVKLLSMLDEVDRRYNHYCEQMQMVVNSFDLVMGFGSAVPYTALAQKAMSRHFRCLKDAIGAQLKNSCELLGEKDAGTSGVSKGETPRLKVLEQSFRQQRAFHQMGLMEQEAWRPQRGLPERSVNILRAWLFEHFLHPYPNDADKHLLSRQTGLSRNQVSNWFINARVRLWKPMVEEMYQQESKDVENEEEEQEQNNDHTQQNSLDNIQATNFQNQNRKHGGLTTTATQNPMPSTATSSSATVQRSALAESDPSLITIPTPLIATTTGGGTYPSIHDPDACQDYAPSELIRFGNTGGDVSLTLGLHHAGRDFGGC